MLKFPPSELAAGAFLVAQHVLMPDKRWGTTLSHYSGYSRQQALVSAKCIAEVRELCRKHGLLQVALGAVQQLI